MLSKEKKLNIQKEIKELEKNSSAELLAVIAQSIPNFLPSFILKLLPKKYRQKLANDFIENYYANIEQKNKDVKDIVLFFVCIDEKFVKIITSKNINNKIPNSFWQNIIDNFIKKVKENKIEDGFIQAIKSSKDILLKEFPSTNDINELPNEVIEI
jgi:putative membrane protein